jgi:hypothetical protein
VPYIPPCLRDPAPRGLSLRKGNPRQRSEHLIFCLLRGAGAQGRRGAGWRRASADACAGPRPRPARSPGGCTARAPTRVGPGSARAARRRPAGRGRVRSGSGAVGGSAVGGSAAGHGTPAPGGERAPLLFPAAAAGTPREPGGGRWGGGARGLPGRELRAGAGGGAGVPRDGWRFREAARRWP